MRILTKTMVGFYVLLSLLIFSMPVSATTIDGLTEDGNATVGTAIVISDIPIGADIFFILNNGVPVFARTDTNGAARYLPLIEGTLKINVMQNGNLIDNQTLVIGPTPTPIPTPTPTPTTQPTRGGTGGGTGTGGSGVNTREPISNIAEHEAHEMSLIAGMPVTYLFTNPDIAIYQLVVTGTIAEDLVTIRVESLNSTSKLVTGAAPENVYKNINIWSGSNNIDSILIRFKVENSWINSNNVAGTNINLFRWDQGKWASLATQEINKDDSFTYFEANTTGLPIFAISTGKISAAPLEGETPIITPGGTPEITKTTEIPTPTKTKTPGFEIVLAIIGIFVIYIGRKVR